MEGGFTMGKQTSLGTLLVSQAVLLPSNKDRKMESIFETLAATPNVASTLLLVATAVKEELPLGHFDTEQAFVRSDSDTEIYLRLTPVCGPFFQMIFQLNKAINGLSKDSQ